MEWRCAGVSLWEGARKGFKRHKVEYYVIDVILQYCRSLGVLVLGCCHKEAEGEHEAG